MINYKLILVYSTLSCVDSFTRVFRSNGYPSCYKLKELGIRLFTKEDFAKLAFTVTAKVVFLESDQDSDNQIIINKLYQYFISDLRLVYNIEQNRITAKTISYFSPKEMYEYVTNYSTYEQVKNTLKKQISSKINYNQSKLENYKNKVELINQEIESLTLHLQQLE